ncbi:hypothetical protein PENSPDRAFT_422682 [Peniophora sp. CONT]|nr:hypothetical protein PENSPDRAFT_422682 [Peniophora sp. CONT]
MANIGDTLVFSVGGKEYTVEMSVLMRQTSMPSSFWLGELSDATQHGITQPEVDAFLAAAAGHNFYVVYTANYTRLEDWYAVLKLSTRWSFDALRNRAISSLEKLITPSEKLFLARAYDVPQWCIPAYTLLALRADPLSVAEVRRLDAEDVVLVTSAREDILHQRLSKDAASVTSHFSRALYIISSKLTPEPNSDPAKASTRSAVPSLFPTSNLNSPAIIVSSPSCTTVPYQTSPSRALPSAGVDISFFTAGKFDEAVKLITPDTVDDILRALSASSGLFPATVWKPDNKHAAHIVLAAMRHGIQDAPFLHIGPRFVHSVLRILGRTESIFAGALQSLNVRFAEFTRSPDRVPKQDKYAIMPPSLTSSAYRACMRNAQAFVVALLQEGHLRSYKWIQQLRPLFPENSFPLNAILSPPEPTGEQANPVAAQSQASQTMLNDYVIVADDPDVPSPSLQIHHSPEFNTAARGPEAVRNGLESLLPTDEPKVILESDVQPTIDSIVAAILAGDYDAGVSHFTPDNIGAVWLALSERAPFQPNHPEPTPGDHRNAPVSLLARAVLRRAFRDSSFALLPTGTSILAQATAVAPWLSGDLMSTIEAVISRWKKFEAARGVYSYLKVDPGCYMSDGPPSSIGNDVYKERMERGRNVIQTLAKEAALVGNKKGARRLVRLAGKCSMA